MDKPEVWMSAPRTPPAFSAWITRLAASLAWRSAIDTEDALVCTPIDRRSSSGVPVTVPVPVTVIFPPASEAVRATPRDPYPGPPVLALADWPVVVPGDVADPSKNAPASSAAAAAPIKIGRYAGLTATFMAALPVCVCSRLRRTPAVTGSCCLPSPAALVVMMPGGDDVQHDGEDHRKQGKRGEVPVASAPQHRHLPQPGGQFRGESTVKGIVPADEDRNSREHGDVERGVLAHAVKNGMTTISRQRPISESKADTGRSQSNSIQLPAPVSRAA